MSTKIKFIVISIFIVLVFLTAGLVLFSKANNLNSRLAQKDELLQKMQSEMKRLQAEKEKLVKKRDKFQADAVSYIAVNAKLQREKEKLRKGIEDARKAIEVKESQILTDQRQLTDLLKKRSARGQDFNMAIEKAKSLQAEKESLEEGIDSLNSALYKERGLYHYNLGVAYSRAKLYDEAIRAYEKSLDFQPDNADANYNLGLLYNNVKGQPVKAVQYYRKYLELKPDAQDRQEIEDWIGGLKVERLE